MTKAFNASDGKSIFSGRKSTGFSNIEEQMAGTTKVNNLLTVAKHHLILYQQDVPFLLEDKIIELGGHYEKALIPFNVS